jgi:hypothetical protein
MLVSHRCRFIYTKTIKTAGTSVEGYFEPYCMAEGSWRASHMRPQHVSPEGIVGFRGHVPPWPFRPRWYNHMPARRIRALLGPRVWSDYFKFTVVRNPFDKLVSGYHFLSSAVGRPTWMARLRSRVGRGGVGVQPIPGYDDETTIANFRSWVQAGGSMLDRDKYMIGGVVCVDDFIRFESLADDIARVCYRLEVPFEPDRIPRYKMGIRHCHIPLREYYDESTLAIVRRLYAWEIDRFGYELPS